MCESMTHSGSGVRSDAFSLDHRASSTLIATPPEEVALPLKMPAIERGTIRGEVLSSTGSQSAAPLNDEGIGDSRISHQTQSIPRDEITQVGTSTSSRTEKLVIPQPMVTPFRPPQPKRGDSRKSQSLSHRSGPWNERKAPESPVQDLLVKACSEEGQYGGKQTNQVKARIEWENGIIRQLCGLLSRTPPENRLLNSQQGRQQVAMSLASALKERVGNNIKLPNFLNV